jgi:hypothetical protein
MLPVLLFAVLISVLLLEDVRAGIEQGARGRARAMMTAVGVELKGSIATLDAPAVSRRLAAGDRRRTRRSASTLRKSSASRRCA